MNGEAQDEGRRGVWTRLKDMVYRPDDYEEDYDEEDIRLDPRKSYSQGSTRPQPGPKVSHVGVKHPQSIDEARLAADGLKDGRQQIINLEKTDQQTSERIIDFLYGVTYALNGFVEKVGDRVYLFAPCNVVIEVGKDSRSSSGFIDR